MIKLEINNANPKNKKTSDCVIRAITLATGKDYYEVLDEIILVSKKTGFMITDKKCIEKYLEQLGYTKYKQPRKLNNTKYLVGEIMEVTKAKNVIVSCAGHLTVVVNGVLNDIWDCRYKCISNYYVKSE